MEKVEQHYDININSSDADDVINGGFVKLLNHFSFDVSYFSHLYWSVLSIVLPCGFYQSIRGDVNDKLVCTIGETTYIITLTAGDYTMTRLLNHLQTAINSALSITTTVTFDNTTKLISIANDNVNAFIITTDSTCEEIIGLATTDLSFPKSETTTFPNVPNLNNVSMVQIHSNIAQRNNYSSSISNVSDIMISLPIKWLSGVLIYENRNGIYTDLTTSLSHLEFRLTDQNNRILNNNGVGWSVIIRIKRVTRRPIIPQEMFPPYHIKTSIEEKADPTTIEEK